MITQGSLFLVVIRSPLRVSDGGQSLTEERNDILNVVEAELIHILLRRNNPNIIPQGNLLEVFFGEILQVSL